MLEPVKVEGFSGGITDFPIGAGPNQYQFSDNWLVSKAAQVYTRPGSVPFSVAFTQLSTGNQRVGSVWNFNEDTALIGQSARRAFYFSAGWQELLGPTGNVCFSAGATTNRVSGSDWKGHLLFTNDGGALPMKIFQGSPIVNGQTLSALTTWQAQTMGLPKFLPANAYSATTVVSATIATFANAVQTQMKAHFANTNYATAHAAPDTGGGSSTAILTAAALVAGDSFALAQTFVYQLTKAYTNHEADAVTVKASRVYHQQIYNNPGAPNIGLSFLDPPKSWLELAKQLNEIKRNFNWHVSSFKGHIDTGGPHTPPLPNDRVATADLASTNQGPTFSDLNYKELLDFWTTLNTAYNAHLTDTLSSHLLAAVMSGTTDAENQTHCSAPTDLNSLFENTVHLYCAYRDHQADASLPIYYLTGNTHHAVGNKNYIDSVAPISTTAPKGQIQNVTVGMYIGTTAALGASGDSFPLGTKVTIVNAAGTKITLDANNNNDGTDGNSIEAAFSTEKYHGFLQPRHDDNFVSDAQKGDLTTFDFGFDSIIGDPGALSSVLSDIALKFNKHDNNYDWIGVGGIYGIHFKAGAHQVATSVIPKVQSFLYEYAFLYRYSYKTLSGESFTVRSAPYFKQKNSYYNIADSSTVIPDLSTFANGANNYDTANITVEVYRSIAGGQVLYYAGSVPLGTIAFKDAVTDSEIIAQEKIYTNGGVLGNDPPPACKIFHVTKSGVPYFGSVTNTLDDGSTETIVNRIQQGVPDGPDFAPAGNFVDLPDAVAGISSIRTLPIGFTKNSTHRLEGSFDEQGQGSITAVTISDRVGLVGSFSPVQVEGGVVFAGPDQFYLTDGYSMTPLGRAWPTTYANIVSASRAYNIQGTFDKLSNRVWWGVTGAGTDNDRCFILDLNFPLSPNGCFTTASNGAYFAPTALCTFQGDIIRGDTRGYVFKHNETYTSDPRLDTTGAQSAATTWFTRWVPYNLTSAAFDFGLSGFRKWCSAIETKLYNFGDASVQITAINDMGRTTGACTPIRSRSWTPMINERRFFPTGSLYFAVKQVKFSNAKVVITNSDTLGLATVTAGTTVTIAAGSFPADMVDHVIAFAADGYVAEFTITNETVGNTVLTVAGAPNVVGTKWVIRGYPKTEKIQLQEYTMWATQMGINQTTALNESGANA